MRTDSQAGASAGAQARISAIIAALALVLAWTAACADFDAFVDPTGGLPDVVVANPSFSFDIQPIFTKRCSIGGCHSVASRQGGLVLRAPFAYDSIVNVRSRLNGAFLRVKPFDADSSWLMRMLGADPQRRFPHSRMPLGSKPLTDNQLATIVNWIEQGAPRN